MLVVQPGLKHDRVDRKRAGVVGDDQRGARLGYVRQPAHPDPEPVLVEHPGDRHQHAAVELGVEAELVDLGLAIELAARELKDVGQPAPPAAVRRASSLAARGARGPGRRRRAIGLTARAAPPAAAGAAIVLRAGAGILAAAGAGVIPAAGLEAGQRHQVDRVAVDRHAGFRLPRGCATDAASSSWRLAHLCPLSRAPPAKPAAWISRACLAMLRSPAGAVPSLPLGRPGPARRQAPALLRAGLAWRPRYFLFRR